MAVDRIIGVDFGTSTSVIRVKRYENGNPTGDKLETKEVIYGGMGSVVPTLVLQKNDPNAPTCCFGYEAQQRRKNYTYHHSFKMDLESADPEKRAQARDLTEKFFGYLARQYKSQSEGGHLGDSSDREHTIVSYPVKWREETKAFMLETARTAGFPNVTGMDEAQAAIQAVVVMSGDHLRRYGLLQNGVASNILLIDMGAGTTDLVLTRYTPGENDKMEVLNTWPKSGDLRFGGREIDQLLQNFFRDRMTPEQADMVFRRVGIDKFKSWKELSVSPTLADNQAVEEFSEFDVQVEYEVEYCLDRAALEDCLSDYLNQFPRLINGCLEAARMQGAEVDLVIVTGGHSQWYFVREMLRGNMPRFGEVNLSRIRENPERIISVSRPQETVALGMAYSGIHMEFSTPAQPVESAKTEAERPGAAEQSRPQAQYTESPEQPGRPAYEAPEWKPSAPDPLAAAYNTWEGVKKAARIASDSIQKTVQQTTEEIRKKQLEEARRRAEASRIDPERIPVTPEDEFEIGSVLGKDCYIKKYIGVRTLVSIPSHIRGRKVVGIGRSAFGAFLLPDANRTVEAVVIPDTVTEIGSFAFANCINLKYLQAKAVQKIETSAFGNCSKLETAVFSRNVSSIGASAFVGCWNMKKMDFGMGEAREGQVILAPNLKTIGEQAFYRNDLPRPTAPIFREVLMSRRTKVRDLPGFKVFPPKFCDVFYYD